MTKIVQSSSPIAMIVCAILLIQFIGCGEDADEDANIDDSSASEAPSLPPSQSMMVDLSLFEQKLIGAPGTAAPSSMKNFAYAATAAAIVNAAVVTAITPPATLYAAARATEPVEQDDGSWLWGFSVKIKGITFTAKLTGVEEVAKNTWSMVVSTDAPLRPVTDFLWYTGESTLKDLSGSWQFFDLTTPDEKNPTVNINWSIDVVKEEANLIIENIDMRSDSKHTEDVLHYRTTLDTASVSVKAASMAFKDASEGETSEIAWDIEARSGSITAPGYNNGEKACWDADKQDVQCDQ